MTLSQAVLDELWDFGDPARSEARLRAAVEAESDASTRAELDSSGSEIELTETSLGQEFDAGGVYGIMNEDASAVDLLWAGANCFAR